MRKAKPLKYFYPRPPRGGRPDMVKLRTGLEDFYPRPPRGGRRGVNGGGYKMGLFLSTPSARRATERHKSVHADGKISIHALREEGDGKPKFNRRHRSNFYPRPPRGGRRTTASKTQKNSLFLSTPSARRATCLSSSSKRFFMISIHALREEGDTVLFRICAVLCNFYPRPPRGGRR